MARIRTVKPELFQHEGLWDLESSTGLPVIRAFIGLFTQCDRDGRFEWRPRRLKAAIMPYDDLDFAAVLAALRDKSFIVQYDARGTRAPRVADASATDADAYLYGCIPTWKKHQSINNKESSSILPAPTSEMVDAANTQLDLLGLDASATRDPRDTNAYPELLGSSQGEREGEKEGEREVQFKNRTIDSGKGRGSQQTAAAISIPLNDKSEFKIQAVQVQEWQELYQAIDVMAELVRFRKWCDENPKRRKTKRGVLTSITRWLSEEQDKGGRRSRAARVGASTSDSERAAQAAMDAVPTLETMDLPESVKNSANIGEAAWVQISKVLAQRINKHSFDTWIKPLRGIGVDEKTLYVAAPTDEFATMAAKYGDLISEVATSFKVDDVRFLAMRL